MLVYAEPDITQKEAQEHSRAYGYFCPRLLDPNNLLSRLAGATVTPEAAIIIPSGKRFYLGRIDNRYAGLGQRREVITQHDLQDALSALAAGKQRPHKDTEAIGCFIAPPKVKKNQ